MAKRRFTCADCGYTFEAAYGTGIGGAQMTCPQCGGRNIHRAEGDRGYDRVRGSGGGPQGPDTSGRGRGGTGRGTRWAR
jgi:transposase-like protein